MEFNWNFRGAGGGGCYKKSFPWVRYGYFMKLHIALLCLVPEELQRKNKTFANCNNI